VILNTHVFFSLSRISPPLFPPLPPPPPPLPPPLREERAQRRRLERLVEHLNVARAGVLAHARAAVGGDQDRRQFGTELPAQLNDSVDAVAVGEVIIDQQPIRPRLGAGDRRLRAAHIGGGEHAAAPSAEQGLHAVEDLRLV